MSFRRVACITASSLLALSVVGCSDQKQSSPPATGGAGGGISQGGAGGSAGGAGGAGGSPLPIPTLDGNQPLIIGHRGLPGLHPEETQPAYEAAVAAGADSLEEDMHLTKDCVLVARHNPWLSDN